LQKDFENGSDAPLDLILVRKIGVPFHFTLSFLCLPRVMISSWVVHDRRFNWVFLEGGALV
jgi:hypothetical protein